MQLSKFKTEKWVQINDDTRELTTLVTKLNSKLEL